MNYISEQHEAYLATAAKLLAAEGMNDAAKVLRLSMAKVENTDFDNWNGGTTIWTIFLLMKPSEYAEFSANTDVLEEQIYNSLKIILKQFDDYWFKVKITLKVNSQVDWQKQNNDISRLTRQNIFDGLKLNKVVWSGQLEEVEFLQRLYDLQSLPSYDDRFSDAAGDIWQHRVNNPEDWDDDWVYNDTRFNLLLGPADQFLRFLCELVHPVVRPEKNEAMNLVQEFNSQLKQEGWHLIEREKIAGRPRFIPQLIQNSNNRSVSRARTVADALDAGWMQQEIERLENAVEQDPALAIGTSKELVETCCKTILSKLGVTVSRSDNLPQLTKKVAKELKLVPEGISDEAKGAKVIRLILQNLSTMTQNLSELRGLYGSGHGRDGKHRGLEPRHARLAVGSAVAFIDFITETYHQRQSAYDRDE